MPLTRTWRVVRRNIAAAIAPLAAIAATLSIATLAPAPAEAKTPGKTYCFYKVCHRVNTIPEMVALVGQDRVFNTSFYDDCKRDRYNPCGLTSSGEQFHPLDADNAASPIYPNGTVLMLRNPDTGEAAVVRVNNAGPYWGKRMLDVSRGVAEKLGFKKRGVANLEVRVVSAPTLADATYKKNRRYDPVPGPIGQYASLDRAQGGMMVAMAMNAMSGSLFAPAASKMLPGLKSANPELALALRSGNAVASLETPLEGLKAAARRAYGADDKRGRRIASDSLVADLAPQFEPEFGAGVKTGGAPLAERRLRLIN